MKNYEITNIRSMDNEVRYMIYSHEESAFFAGYDFMGSVNWVKIPSPECELTEEDDPWQIVDDLESADEDPVIEKFQRLLDAAVIERDDFGKQWQDMASAGNDKLPTSAHRMYIRYQQAQGYLEGMTTAIFAAGYNIVSSVNSTKLTVTK